MCCRFAVLAQSLEVVDLAVEHDGVSSERVEHRLMAGGAEIDDAQAGMPKGARSIRRRPKSAVVRAAMGDAGHHRMDRLSVRVGYRVQLAGYAAHVLDLPAV